MDSGKPLEFSATQKVYRPSPRRYLKYQVLTTGVFPVVVFGLMLLMIPILTQPPEQKIPALIIALIFLGPIEAFFVYYLLWRTHVRLVISGEGIGYFATGFRIFTPWENVAGFGVRDEFFQSGRNDPGRTRQISGLELHQPAPVYKARPLVRFFLRIHQLEETSPRILYRSRQ